MRKSSMNTQRNTPIIIWSDIIIGITIRSTATITISTPTKELAMSHDRLDEYDKYELQMSPCSQLDVVGMQPHAREYLEHELNYVRSERKYEMFEGGYIDCPSGIQFSGMP